MNKIGLYFHFPFCRKKCLYCDFYSVPLLSRSAAYEKALVSSLLSYREALSDYEIDSVYLGGGTPSLMSDAGLSALFSALGGSFHLARDCEISCEANPESATYEKLSAMRRTGVNRLSLGMQSARNEELAALGRIHTDEETKRAVDAARRAGFRNLSVDLMFALPEQTLEDWLQNLETALSFSPEHLSFYCLTLADTVPLYAKTALLPDEETQRAMYLEGLCLTEKNGYLQYEISNSAKDGFRCRHNERYWQREEYLGIGSGAFSFFRGKRFSVKPDIEAFVQAPCEAEREEDCRLVSQEDAITETIMLSLRTAKGLDLKSFAALAGKERTAEVAEKLSALALTPLCRKTENGFGLTKDGFFVSNEIISKLI